MPQCEWLATCAFFNDRMPDHTGLGAGYKRKYCLDAHTLCARHLVRSRCGAAAVPPNLYPNMTERAWALIMGAR